MDLEKIKQELLCVDLAKGIEKDILIVVHNQYEYIRNCVYSIYKNTKNFNLFIWDNKSDDQTSNYLKSLSEKNKNIKLYRSEENVGFIIPNNTMIKDATSPYIILLNSDTEVKPMWDKVLIGFLKKDPEVAVVGFQGAKMNSQGLGESKHWGYDIDYVCGYCMCFSKKTYEQFGLFDDVNLKFAYCEDSDFCMRIREKNKKIYACYAADLVVHFGNKTSLEVIKHNDFSPIIRDNINYIQNRWSKYLKHD